MTTPDIFALVGFIAALVNVYQFVRLRRRWILRMQHADSLADRALAAQIEANAHLHAAQELLDAGLAHFSRELVELASSQDPIPASKVAEVAARMRRLGSLRAAEVN